MIVVPRPRHNSLLDRALAFGVRAASDVSDIEHRANMRMHAQLTHATGRKAEALARSRTRGMKH